MPRMEYPEFENLVSRVSGLDPGSDFVQAAVWKEAKERGRLFQERAQIVAADARARASRHIVRDQDEGDEGIGWVHGLNAETAVISTALCKRLEPWARELRARCFDNNPEPPFREWGAALKWIRTEVERDRGDWRSNPVSRSDTEAEMQRWADLAGLEIKLEPRWLRYYELGNEYTQLAPAFPGTTIEKLARETNRVAEETAFHPVVLTAFVLCGEAPEISRIRITETSKACRILGDRIPSRWVTVRFSAADVTDEELRELRRSIRRFFGATNTARLAWPDAAFLALVDDMGGPPEHGKTRFWEEVLRRWNAHPASRHRPLSSWRAVRNKHERLAERTNLQELMTPNPPPSPERLRQLAEKSGLRRRDGD